MYRALSTPEALVKLIGAPQTGKSTLCEKLMLYMQHKDFRVVYFRYAIESPDMLRAMLARELDLPNSTNFARMLEDIPINNDGKPLILIFDEAHLLTDTTLLQIFRLLEVQSGAARKLNIVLCAEPQLEQRLARGEELKSLLMHISHSIVLQAMTSTELAGFLRAYLEKAALPGLQLAPAALTYFHKCTNGLPGPTRTLCSKIVAARAGDIELQPISKAELAAIVQRSQDGTSDQLLPATQLRDTNQWVVLGPVLAVVVFASVGMLYQQLLRDGDGDVETNIATIPAAVDNQSPFVPVDASVSTAIITAVEVPQVTLIADVQSVIPTAVALAPPTEIEVPDVAISDSDLVLVTAAERGVADAEVVEPVFEDVPFGPLATTAALAASTVASSVVDPVAPAAAAVVEALAEPVIIAATAIHAAEVEPDITATDTESTAVQPLANSVASASAEFVANESVQDNATQELTVGAARLDIDLWLAAWQEQNLDAYFASYHADFVPRYHPSSPRWRQDRTRVINNARSISLALAEYEILPSTPERLEVQFWLDYKSATYADSTQKKLVLGRQAGHWLILEEINLQVRP